MENIPKNSWLNFLEIYHIVKSNIDHFESRDFDPLADYNQQERWKRNVKNSLQTLKAKDKIQGDGNANYLLGANSNNVLRTEVTSMDVAILVVDMLGKTFSKITRAQVPIDGGNERVI